MAEQKRRALLGRIAEFGWFVQQGEPAATQSLAMLLEDPPLRDVFLRHVEGLTGTCLGAVRVFIPEVVHHDRGRPDLEGQDDQGRPLLVVEAKFSAALDPAQVHSYLVDQAQRLAPETSGAFVLLVPQPRVAAAELTLRAALDRGAGGARPVTAAVTTWDDFLRVFDDAVGVIANAQDLAGDLVQFQPCA